MLFYLPDFQNPVLPETEALHCLKVLRKKTGDHILVSDGKGRKAEAEILGDNPKKCLLKLRDISTLPKGWKNEIWLAVAPTKQMERMEWLVEKCTEIGIDGLIFIKTERTERDVLKLERLEKTALSAMKQSGQAWLPQLKWQANWKQFPWADFQHIYCADLGTDALASIPKKEGKSLIFIGPEGDFTKQEILEIYTHGAAPIRLRPHVLRTETAGIFALSLFHFGQI